MATYEMGFRISERFARLTVLLMNMTKHLAAHAQRLGVSEEQVAELNEFKTRWDEIQKRYLDPGRHNAAAVADAQNGYKQGEKLTRGLQQQIKNNRQTTLTGEDFEALDIRPKKTTLTRAKRPLVSPALSVARAGTGKIVIKTVVPERGEILHRRLPYGCKLLARISYEPEADRFDQIIISGRSTFSFEPQGRPMGTKGFVKACYFNTRGDLGPECEPFEFVVN